MSNFNLSKRLQPAKKAWKSFKSHLRTRKFAGAITNFRRCCAAAWRSISPFIHRKLLSPPRPRRHFHRSNHAVHVDELFSWPVLLTADPPRKTKENMDESKTITCDGVPADKSRPGSKTSTDHDGPKIQIQHVDKLFVEIPAVKDEKGSKAAWKGKAKAGESSESTSDPAFINKWKIPQFRGVDERAEEFIAKFRQDMKLEREQSIVEFLEMLKRSA